MTTRTVIIDTDTGVDDALALVFLARHPGVTIRAVHSTHGNCSALQAANNARAVLEVCGLAEVEIRIGLEAPPESSLKHSSNIHGEDGLGGSGIRPHTPVEGSADAAEHLVEQVNRDPGSIDLLALGSLTNVAAALRVDPLLFHKLRSVTIVGSLGPAMFGDREPWLDRRFRISKDPNVSHDIHAAETVASAEGNVTWCGPYVTRQCLVPEQRLRDAATRTGDPAAELIAMINQSYADFYTASYPQPDGERVVGINDGIAAAILTDPELVLGAVRRPMRTFTGPDGIGYLAGVHRTVEDQRPDHRVIYDVDFPRIIDGLIASLGHATRQDRSLETASPRRSGG